MYGKSVKLLSSLFIMGSLSLGLVVQTPYSWAQDTEVTDTTDGPVEEEPTEKEPVEKEPVEKEPTEKEPIEKEPAEEESTEKKPVEKPKVKPLTCPYVEVSGKIAWLKQYPRLNSKTLMTVKKGEKLWRIGKFSRFGWRLYSRSNGRRYWAHQSVLKCREGEPLKVKVPEIKSPFPKLEPAEAPETCLHILRCAINWSVPNRQKTKFTMMFNQVQEQLQNPLTKLTARDLCHRYQKETLEIFPNCGFRFDVYGE